MKQEIGESSSFAKRQTNEGLFTEQELSLPRPPPYLTGKFIGMFFFHLHEEVFCSWQCD